MKRRVTGSLLCQSEEIEQDDLIFDVRLLSDLAHEARFNNSNQQDRPLKSIGRPAIECSGMQNVCNGFHLGVRQT